MDISIILDGRPTDIDLGPSAAEAAREADRAKAWATGIRPDGDDSKSSREWAGSSAGSAGDAAASAAAIGDALNDGASLQRALMASVGAGRGGLDLAVDAIQGGLIFDFAAGIYRIAGVNHRRPGDFAELVATRLGAAYALDKAGRYQSFAANTLRVTDRGAVIEAAATNLLAKPTDFTKLAASQNGRTISKTPGVAPTPFADGSAPGLQIGWPGGGTGYGWGVYDNTGFVAATAGAHTLSFILRPDADVLPFLGFEMQGMVPVVEFTIDFTDPAAPVITNKTGSSTRSIEVLANGRYRLRITTTPAAGANVKWGWYKSDGRAGANRVTMGGGTVMMTLYHQQAELGSIPTSPILVGGGARAADAVTLALPAGVAADELMVGYEGGTSRFRRSALANQARLDLIADAGAPWAGKLIRSIALMPAFDRRLLEPTPAGAKPYLVVRDGVTWWDGTAYPDEAALVAAAGGSGAGNGMVLADYVAPDAPNLLGMVDFGVDQQRFTVTNKATGAVDASYLVAAFQGATYGALTRKMVLPPARAIRLSGTVKAGPTSGDSVKLAVSTYSSNFGISNSSAAGVPSNGGDRSLSVTASTAMGDQVFLGLYLFTGTGTGYLKAPVLTEIMPAKGWPAGPKMIEIVAVAPNPLPAANADPDIEEQVIVQVDAGDPNDRARLTIASDGTVRLRARIKGGADGQTGAISLGQVAAGAPIRAIVGLAASYMRGALNGAAGVDYTTKTLPVGASAFRIGRNSAGGNVFAGSVQGYRIWDGVDSLDWMRRQTAIAPTSSKRIWLDGDSWSAWGTGIATQLADMGYEVYCTGTGGSTFAQAYARMIDPNSLADFAGMTLVIWDASPNGHTAGQSDDEVTKVADIVGRLGHDRWLYIRSGQIDGKTPTSTVLTTGRTQESRELDDVAAKIAARFGAVHVLDPLPAAAKLPTGDPASALWAAVQSDIAYGYFPRTLMIADGAHLTTPTRNALVPAAIAPAIEAVRRL